MFKPAVFSVALSMSLGGVAQAGCPKSTCTADSCCLTHNQDQVDMGTQVACGNARATRANGFARCFNLAAEGVPGDLTIDSVKIGIAQFDSPIVGPGPPDVIPVNINIYQTDSCTPPIDWASSVLIATEVITVSVADEGTVRIVPFTSPPTVPAGGNFVVEIETTIDGTLGVPGADHGFWPMSNAVACSDALIRTAACGLSNWFGVTSIGFPDSQTMIFVSGHPAAGGTPVVCGDGVVTGCEGCDPPDGVTCTEVCKPATELDQLAKLLPDDGAAFDRFGNSVSISSATTIVGAPRDDDNGSASGSAYLFDTTTGQQIAKLLPDDGAEFDTFGTSVGISGSTAIIGAPRDDSSGSAYLFDTTTGQQIAKLLPDVPLGNFGWSVAISGATAIVGAPWEGFGAAYLFDTTTGQQIAKLLPSDPMWRGFGITVAIGRETAIVGAFDRNEEDGAQLGSATLFDATTGQQIARLVPNDGAQDTAFGATVGISGATAIVGAPWDDDNGHISGSAYLFDTTTGGQVAKLLPDDGAAEDFFGTSVAISGATAIVGAPGAPWNDNNSGSAYLFDISDPANPTQLFKLLPNDGAADDFFGNSIAISGDTAIGGAPGDDDNGSKSGSAYLFDAAGDADGDGIPDDEDACPESILTPTIIIDGCDSGVGNVLFEDGCTMADLIAECADGAANHGQFVSCVALLSIEWKRAGLINGREKGRIQSCAARSNIAGDLDGDGAVGVADLVMLLGEWGPCRAHPDTCPADLDLDDIVGITDLLILLGNWE